MTNEQTQLIWRAKWMGRLSLAQSLAASIAALMLVIDGTPGREVHTAAWAATAMLSLASAEVWRWARVKHEREG